MKLRIFSSFLFAIVCLAAFVPANAQTVSGKLSANHVSRGSSIKGSVTLSLPEGLHVNSNKPSTEYLIPTSLRISGEGLKGISVDYPEGKDRKFQFSEEELNVYEGEVVIPFTVLVPRGFRGDSVTVRAVLHYQACTDEVCYPPKNEEVKMTVSVK